MRIARYTIIVVICLLGCSQSTFADLHKGDQYYQKGLEFAMSLINESSVYYLTKAKLIFENKGAVSFLYLSCMGLSNVFLRMGVKDYALSFNSQALQITKQKKNKLMMGNVNIEGYKLLMPILR